MGIIAEQWATDEGVQLSVQRVSRVDRLRGLIGRRRQGPGEALLIPCCGCVHGVGMTRTIDVVFVDHAFRVTSTCALRPFGLASCRRGAHAFELAHGEVARLALKPGCSLAPLSTQAIKEGEESDDPNRNES